MTQEISMFCHTGVGGSGCRMVQVFFCWNPECKPKDLKMDRKFFQEAFVSLASTASQRWRNSRPRSKPKLSAMPES